MTSASITFNKQPPDVLVEVDVWLEVGRNGRSFTYLDRKKLGVDLGDLVLVSLRGRTVQGLVVAKRPSAFLRSAKCIDGNEETSSLLLNDVEEIIQPAAVGARWREWLDAMVAESLLACWACMATAWLDEGSRRFRAVVWLVAGMGRATGLDVFGANTTAAVVDA